METMPVKGIYDAGKRLKKDVGENEKLFKYPLIAHVRMLPSKGTPFFMRFSMNATYETSERNNDNPQTAAFKANNSGMPVTIWVVLRDNRYGVEPCQGSLSGKAGVHFAVLSFISHLKSIEAQSNIVYHVLPGRHVSMVSSRQMLSLVLHALGRVLVSIDESASWKARTHIAASSFIWHSKSIEAQLNIGNHALPGRHVSTLSSRQALSPILHLVGKPLVSVDEELPSVAPESSS
ncbi:MAG: hypothetical protein JXR76_07130 [Deltaproteobacteria bacterium]|nr:hypothetical protein [Deltaproteobacteria bacterium]